MKNLYLHIGLSKTGTSALQVMFAQNKDLLKKYGIHYPAWSIEDALKGRISSGNGLKIAKFLNDKLAFKFPLENIRAEIEHELSFNFPIVLFSSEFLYDFDLQKMNYFKEIAEGKDYQIKIICYVRDFVPMYESLYGQEVKRGLCTKTFKEYISSAIVSNYLIIKRFIDYFDKDSLVVKKYSENFNTAELIISFFDIFNILIDINNMILPDIINPNLSLADLEVMRKLNESLKNHQQARRISDGLLEKLKQGVAKLKIADSDDAAFILKRHHEETVEINKLIKDDDLLHFDTERTEHFECSNNEKIESLVKIVLLLIKELSNTRSDENTVVPMLFPLGHFYSPVANPIDIKSRENKIWSHSNSIEGINLNIPKQLELLKQLKPYVASINYPVENNGDDKTYFYKNDQYPILDAEFLYTILCHFKPKNMIEIGSGYSSLVTADVNRRILNNSINFSCIEPYPRQFLIDGIDGITQLITKKVEDVELSFFERLNEGDILFIDSSHVSKVGSDVNFLFFEVIPRLKKGVMIHIHDIFLPDEYPKGWVIEQGRNWNEQYLLRAFLQFNSDWEVMWATCFMATRYTEIVRDAFPRYPKLGGGGSFWLKRINFTELKEMPMNDLLNVIIRVHSTDERSLKSLSFCLFSLFGQNYSPLRPIIVCQNFDDEQLAKIKVIVDESLWDNSDIMSSTISHQLFYPIIHNVVLDKKGDFRSKLLNEGIKLSTGRYLAFLDYDDLIYGHAYSYLIDRLNKKEAAISFGDIKRTDVSYLDGYFYQHKKFAPFGYYSKNLHDLFIDNFCPIHSFVIDKNKIDSQDLYFDESLSKSEDYHFLLRITAKYKSDFAARSRFVGEYLVRTDGTNTISTYRREGDDCLTDWQKAVAKINELKKDIPAPVVSVAEVAVLKQASYQSAHLVQEINTLKEKLATEIKNIEAISQLLNLFFNVPENIKKLPRVGNLEESKQIGSKVNFKGWVADLEKQTSVLSLAIVHLPTHKTLGFYAPNILRPDVERVKQLPPGKFYGFLIELQTTFPVNELSILAILKNGEIIAINQASIFN